MLGRNGGRLVDGWSNSNSAASRVDLANPDAVDNHDSQGVRKQSGSSGSEDRREQLQQVSDRSDGGAAEGLQEEGNNRTQVLLDQRAAQAGTRPGIRCTYESGDFSRASEGSETEPGVYSADATDDKFKFMTVTLCLNNNVIVLPLVSRADRQPQRGNPHGGVIRLMACERVNHGCHQISLYVLCASI